MELKQEMTGGENMKLCITVFDGFAFPNQSQDVEPNRNIKKSMSNKIR